MLAGYPTERLLYRPRTARTRRVGHATTGKGPQDSLPAELEGALQAAARQVRATDALRDQGVEPAAAQRALAPPAFRRS